MSTKVLKEAKKDSKKILVASADSPSLWNNTIAPGWTPKEHENLRLALMYFGVGRWSKIIEKGVLPGKTNAQLYLQTQRMLGQQSLGEFMGMQLDAQKVYAENEKKTDVTRKNGCIINTQDNLTNIQKKEKQEEARKRFQVTPEQGKEAGIKLGLVRQEGQKNVNNDTNEEDEEPVNEQATSIRTFTHVPVALKLKKMTELKDFLEKELEMKRQAPAVDEGSNKRMKVA